MNNRPAKHKDVLFVPQHAFVDEVAFMYAPQKGYVIKIIPLMLEHAWRQKKIKSTSSFEELLHSGWICRLVTLDKRVLNRHTHDEIPGWSIIRDHLIECLNECKNEMKLPEMVHNCMAAVQPILESRFEAHYYFPARMFHCWWYTIHEEETLLALHLINAYQPESPFNHLNHFLSTMLQAVEEATVVYPGIQTVACGSWLNQVPKFQQLWPAGFSRNQNILNETGGLGPGAWGQYMTTAGGFSETKASILRQTGKHPFTLTEAQSPVGDVIAHLKELVP